MAAFWVTEALPLAVTSLIPVVLLPLFGKTKLKHILTLKLQKKILRSHKHDWSYFRLKPLFFSCCEVSF
jgi:di/tricarboxylate transporter